MESMAKGATRSNRSYRADQDGADGADGADGQDGATGSTGATGADGQDGVACWDLNGDGIQDTSEDVNGDGNYNALISRYSRP